MTNDGDNIKQLEGRKSKTVKFIEYGELGICVIVVGLLLILSANVIVSEQKHVNEITSSYARQPTIDTSFLDTMNCQQIRQFINDTGGLLVTEDPNHNTIVSKASQLENSCLLGMTKPDAKIANCLTQYIVYETTDGKTWYRTPHGDFTYDQIIQRGICN